MLEYIEMKHILSARQFSKNELTILFNKADEMREAILSPVKRQKLAGKYKGCMIATLFYEPSTRTRLSFESAAQRLGLGILSTENAREFSSAIKGETIEDTTRVINSYADIIVMRHHETGAADRAAAVSKVPIINAGDGKGEHPTQGLLDLYTILKEKGRLDNLNVVIGGDLANGRTARSLAQMLSLYESNTICFVSTPELKIGDDIKKMLKTKQVKFVETDNMNQALKDADVVYWTRLQKERLTNQKTVSNYSISKESLKIIPAKAIIMHPLPRVDEIAPEVDADPRAAYFRQAGNGLYIRMALIDQILKNK